jgi:hypothetical protein
MKLAAIYTVYNGTDLLLGSIKQALPFVDIVILACQTTSNTGNESNEVNQWIDKNADFLADNEIVLIDFEPNLSISTKQNERDKLQKAINLSLEMECTHYVLLACDHYYKPAEFKAAKEFVQEHNFDVTLSMMYTFYKFDNWRVNPIESYAMPFICRITPETKVTVNKAYPILTDPSVQIAPAETFHVFGNELMLYHFSMIRVDIREKFANAAASIRWNKEDVKRFVSEFENAHLGSEISYFQGRKLVECEHGFVLE